jgi:hypothetical protein
MRIFLLALLLAAPAIADPISGADDPAFRAPFDRALQTDDPTALLDLHAAAEAGNTAALLALPAVNHWLRATLPFADRKRIARVNGTPLAEAVAAADQVAELWAEGEFTSPPETTLDRSLGLFAAGETQKAIFLFQSWVNQTGGGGPLPDGLFDLPIPDWTLATLFRSRMTGFDPTTMADTKILLARRLKADDPAAYFALNGLAGLDGSDQTVLIDEQELTAMIFAAGLTREAFDRRRAELLPALRLTRAWAEPVDAATALAGWTQIADDPGFEPLHALCQASCTATASACMAAYVAGFGPPQGYLAQSQPFISLIPEAEFLATPRGSRLLLGPAAVPVDDPRVTTVRQIDACLADTLTAPRP